MRRASLVVVALLILAALAGGAWKAKQHFNRNATAQRYCDGIRSDEVRMAAADRPALIGNGAVEVFLGDSYTQGHMLPTPMDDWAFMVAAAEHVRPLVDGWGSSGYTNSGYCPGDHTYGARVGIDLKKGPITVVVQGSINDAGASTMQIRTAALALYRRVETAHIRLVVVGPSLVPAMNAIQVERIAAALQSAAAQVGVRYINALGWLQGPGLVGPDHAHPTVAGQQAMAVHFLAADHE